MACAYKEKRGYLLEEEKKTKPKATWKDGILASKRKRNMTDKVWMDSKL